MSTILVDDLVAALNAETIQQSLEIVRSSRPSVLGSIAGFTSPEVMSSDRKIQWLDYKINARADQLSAAVADGTATTWNVDNGAKFRPRMLIRAESTGEVAVVVSVSGNALTVQRGINGVAAAIADNAVITVQSVAREENSLADSDSIDQPSKEFNLVQTMDTTIEMSDDAMKVAQYGDTNQMALQISNQMMQLQYQMNNALIGGTRGSFTVGGKESFMTGGMRYFAEQNGVNVDNSAAALTLDQINAVYETVFNNGGQVSRIAVGTSLGRKLNALVSAEYSSNRLSEWSSDQGSLISLPSDLPLFGGVTNIVIDNTLGASELFMYDPSRIQIVPAAANQSDSDGGWKTLDATQKGQDGMAVRVIGKMALRLRDSATHLARIHNIG
jgi:hypothetical protein